MINKKILFFSVLVVLILPLLASAQLHTYGPSISLRGVLNSLVGSVWIIFAGIVIVCFLVAGTNFLTAQGDPGKLKIAKAAALWGVAGVAIGILAYSAISIVGNIIGG